jgi:hypothetical protein
VRSWTHCRPDGGKKVLGRKLFQKIYYSAEEDGHHADEYDASLPHRIQTGPVREVLYNFIDTMLTQD